MNDEGTPTRGEVGDAAEVEAAIAAIEADARALRLRWDAPEEDDLSWLALEIVEPLSADATGWTTTQWWEAFGDSLVGEAMASGARDFGVRFHTWGVVFEAGFRDDAEVFAFRDRLGVRTALDQLGQLGFAFSFGRRGGGGAGSRRGRPPTPLAGAGAVELPIPEAVGDDIATPLGVPATI
jgi:hypothetical protein